MSSPPGISKVIPPGDVGPKKQKDEATKRTKAFFPCSQSQEIDHSEMFDIPYNIIQFSSLSNGND